MLSRIAPPFHLRKKSCEPVELLRREAERRPAVSASRTTIKDAAKQAACAWDLVAWTAVFWN